MQAVASQLAKVGITLNITPETSESQWSAALNTAPVAEQGSWTVDLAAVYYGLFMANKASGWSDPVLNSLFTKAVTAPVGSTQEAADWKQLMGRTVTQAYFMPTILAPRYVFVNTKIVGNVDVTPKLGGVFINPADWLPR
jgi:ABC-type transport system substrate-binding protein